LVKSVLVEEDDPLDAPVGGQTLQLFNVEVAENRVLAGPAGADTVPHGPLHLVPKLLLKGRELDSLTLACLLLLLGRLLSGSLVLHLPLVGFDILATEANLTAVGLVVDDLSLLGPPGGGGASNAEDFSGFAGAKVLLNRHR